ncbi:hypothetical protein WJX79_002170 [Trebouxia sp. C0005]
MADPTEPSIERHGTLTGGRPGPPRFSKHVIHNHTLYIAGQVPYDLTDKSYKGQTEQVLKLIDTILEEGGSSKKNILKVCSFLRSIDEGADEYNAAWDAWCDRENLPVRTTIEAKLMSPEFLVEIDIVAAVQ